MSTASAACAATVSAVSIVSSVSGRLGSSETSVSVARSSEGVAIGITAAVEPRSRNGTSSRWERPSSSAEPESSRTGRPSASRRRAPLATTGSGWSKIAWIACWSCGLADVDGLRDERLAALVRKADHSGIDLEQLDERACDRVQGAVEGKALREGARDLVERREAPCRHALGV